MHELSIAHSLVSLVERQLPPGVTHVTAVDLRVGALAGVVAGALEFCYGIAVDGTVLHGSTLRIEELPIVIHCDACGEDRTLGTAPVFRCPVCGGPSGDIRQGRELDLVAIEYDPPEAEAT